MRCALEQVIEIVTEARSSAESRILSASIYNGIKDFKVGWENRRDGYDRNRNIRFTMTYISDRVLKYKENPRNTFLGCDS